MNHLQIEYTGTQKIEITQYWYTKYVSQYREYLTSETCVNVWCRITRRSTFIPPTSATPLALTSMLTKDI